MRELLPLIPALGCPLLVLWELRSGRLRDRADHGILLAISALLLLFARATVDWTAAPPWVWLIGLLLFVVASVAAVRKAAGLPWFTAWHHKRRITWTGLQLLVVGALAVLLV
ncbi:hypothetical protein [Kribbella sp. NPDC048928]|uniref:hypothetical protein n=1 Tax=Kribbella sp. NPDC048928 TaxID=3364111 RepID=UPI0037218046